MFVLDSHCDTPSQIIRQRDLSKDNEFAHVDFPKLRQGGVDGAFFALYIPSRFDDRPDQALKYAETLYSGVIDVLKDNPDKARLTVSAQDAYENKSQGLFSLFLGLENASPIGDNISMVKYMYDKGIRYITLCHASDNLICDSCASEVKRWGGLSSFGREVVAEMNSLGMLIDVSHLSDDSFYDVLKYSTRPVVATHSCCRALCNHPRNMTDDMIKDLAAAGGVIQVNFYPLFLDSSFGKVLADSGIMKYGEKVEEEFIKDPGDTEKRAAWNAIQKQLQDLARPSYTLIADHIDHVVDLVGIEHVGIGSDFDGIEVAPMGMEDISMMPKLFEELRSRGYSEPDLCKIAGENFFRCAFGFSDAGL